MTQKGQRRSERHRADKYSRRAAAMLDQFYWDEAEGHFLAIMEAAILDISEIRELTWAALKDGYEGLRLLERPFEPREKFLESFRACLARGVGFYGEELFGSEGSPRMFSRESLKHVTKELDQFKI